VTGQPFLVPSVIFAAISIPLVVGLVPPNRYYGFRTTRALESTEVWYAANRHGGIAVLLASVTYLLLARLLPYHEGAPDDFRVWLIQLAGLALPLFAAFVSTSRRSRRL
jgi:hypothetical protein